MSLTPLARFLIFCFSALLLSGCATPTQMVLDAEVKRLCAIDGGIKVYETVPLPADRFDKFGKPNFRIPSKEYLKPQDEYFYTLDIFYYREGNPEVSREHIKMIRRSDGVVLGEAVFYGRGGGDISGPWHDSSFHCPDLTKQPYLETSIFVREKQK